METLQVMVVAAFQYKDLVLEEARDQADMAIHLVIIIYNVQYFF